MYIITALSAFLSILFDRSSARLWKSLTYSEEGEIDEDSSRDKKKKKGSKKVPEDTFNNPDAVYTLTLLQREGRLVDFLMEDISGFEDSQVGAAVRQIHSGCRKILDENFSIQPVTEKSEGEDLTVREGFNPEEYELTGDVSGEPPFTGSLRHKGWKAKKVDLPQRQKRTNPHIVCPAEVEI